MWSIEQQSGDSNFGSEGLKKVKRSDVELERFLENWIVNDVSLIGGGLTLVGQQLSIDDGRLDLLAIDSQERWVVIEVKVGQLESRALCQALYYAASLVRLDAEELRDKLKDSLHSAEDSRDISWKIESMLKNEGEHREIALMLVGVGVHPGLKRMKEFLERFEIPISVVSFEVFETDAGSTLLVREVIEEVTEPAPPKTKRTVEKIRQMAKDAGVEGQLKRFMQMSEEAGLAVVPQQMSIRIAPPSPHRRRYLMYASPYTDETTGIGGMVISATGSEFIKYFPAIDQEKAKEFKIDDRFTVEKIEQALNRIRDFLDANKGHIKPSESEEDQGNS